MNEEKLRYIGRCIGRFRYLIASYALKKQSRKFTDIDELVNLALKFDFINVNIIPMQIRKEIIYFLQLVKKNKPKVILEIGTAYGGSLFLPKRHLQTLLL